MMKKIILFVISLTCVLSWLSAAVAQDSSPQTYTVQVVALSDGLKVEDLRSALVSQGYPAYVIEAGNEDVPLYRLRVGAFASRDTAKVFAEALASQLPDYEPSVALLDSVAANTPRLQAALLARYPYVSGVTTVQVVPWGQNGQGRALRFQAAYANQWYEAVYQIFEPELVERPFHAWRATDMGNGYVARVYNLYLWPNNFTELDEASLTSYQNTLLNRVANELATSVQEIINTYVFFDEGTGMPYLVLGEGRNLITGDSIFYPVVGYPNGNTPQAGPQGVWLDRGAEGSIPEVLTPPVFNLQIMPGVQLSEATLPEPNSLQLRGKGWLALPDAGFISLSDGTNQWKAALGYPLYAHGEFLLTHYGNEILLYRVTSFNP